MVVLVHSPLAALQRGGEEGRANTVPHPAAGSSGSELTQARGGTGVTFVIASGRYRIAAARGRS